MNAKSTRLLLNGEAPALTIMIFVLAFFKPYKPLHYSRKINKTQQLHTAQPFSDVNDSSDGTTMTNSLLWNSEAYYVFPRACPALMNVVNIHIFGFFNICFNIIFLFCRGRGGLKTLRKGGYSCRLFHWGRRKKTKL